MKTLRVIAATNAMKGTVSARDAGEIVAAGVNDAVKLFRSVWKKEVALETVIRPVADGGDDTVDVLSERKVVTPVCGPFLDRVDAQWGVLGDTAVIELAKASGIALQHETKLDPFCATSYGTGELIGKAIDAGYKRVILAIGGSATVDGGIGAMGALGAKFFDKENRVIKPHGNLACEKVARVDVSGFLQRCRGVEFAIACDVDSPLLGPTGAAAMFGPQKMAPVVRNDVARKNEAVRKLEHNLDRFAQLLVKSGGKDVAKMKGIGAAGAFSLGFCSFGLAKLRRGADLVLEALKFEQYKDFDVTYTSEGFCDSQTLRGKAPYAVCEWMKNSHVVVLCGGIESGDVEKKMCEAGASVVTALVDKPMPLSDAIKHTPDLMRRAAFRTFYSFLCQHKQ